MSEKPSGIAHHACNNIISNATCIIYNFASCDRCPCASHFRGSKSYPNCPKIAVIHTLNTGLHGTLPGIEKHYLPGFVFTVMDSDGSKVTSLGWQDKQPKEGILQVRPLLYII